MATPVTNPTDEQVDEARAPDPGPGIPEILDEEEACGLLRISPSTAWRLRRARKLGYCKYGARVLYKREHILAFLGAHEIPANSEQPANVLRMVKAS